MAKYALSDANQASFGITSKKYASWKLAFGIFLLMRRILADNATLEMVYTSMAIVILEDAIMETCIILRVAHS